MIEHEELNEHEQFKQLAALAISSTLTSSERSALGGHYQVCGECRELYQQNLVLIKQGIPLLAARYVNQEDCGNWDDTPTRRKLFDRVRTHRQTVSSESARQLKIDVGSLLLSRIPFALAWAIVAACLVGAIGIVGYRLGTRTWAGAKQPATSAVGGLQKLMAEKQKAVDKLDELLDAQRKNLLELQREGSQRDSELTKLQGDLRLAQEQANELAAAKGTMDQQLRTVTQQRDSLSGQLRVNEQAYQSIQAELSTLRAERDKAVLRTASLESRMEELSASNRDQEQRLLDDEQYLASDRDIRELMGARKLYIADVFDVDSRSRTQKPFGRVFYTQRKSLIFYAFDLDHQSVLRNASAFQAWGLKDTNEGKPLNLGIFYMDSESNRRWVLRIDDPKQLAEIDSVFVTVEPQGGSQKPTGKPFLYTLLRKEANHP
jgi:hypothetical protein